MTIQEFRILNIENILIMLAERELIFLEHAVALIKLGCLNLSLCPLPLISYYHLLEGRYPNHLLGPLLLDIEFKLLPLCIFDLLIGMNDHLWLYLMVASIGAIGRTGLGADRSDHHAHWPVGIPIGDYLARLRLYKRHLYSNLNVIATLLLVPQPH
jgi:hypothetical protein